MPALAVAAEHPALRESSERAREGAPITDDYAYDLFDVLEHSGALLRAAGLLIDRLAGPGDATVFATTELVLSQLIKERVTLPPELIRGYLGALERARSRGHPPTVDLIKRYVFDAKSELSDEDRRELMRRCLLLG